MNSSLENWHVLDESELGYTWDKIKDDTLYYRQKLLENKIKKKVTSILYDEGMNPGAVQSFLKEALTVIAKEKKMKLPKVKNIYSYIAEKLGLYLVEIVEMDTQKTDIKLKKDTMYSTWSATAFEGESLDNSFFGFGTHEDELDYLIKPDDVVNPHVRFFPVRGLDLMAESTCLDWNGKETKYDGFIISHGEASSISKFLESPDKKYRPSCYYCYKPCDAALDSLNRLRENGYKYLPKSYVFKLDDIINLNGYDTVGIKLYFKDGSKYFAGSSINVEQAHDMGFIFSTPTLIQVAGTISSALKILMKNRHKGLLDPLDLPQKELLKNAIPYYGNVFFEWLKK